MGGNRAEITPETRTAFALAGLEADKLPSVETVMNRGRGMEVRLDDKMESASGWLLPDGKYYACSTMEHVGLAEELLKVKVQAGEAGGYERVAEDRGWIKISYGMLGLYVIGKNKATKRQLTKLWDYSVLHGEDYEKMTSCLID